MKITSFIIILFFSVFASAGINGGGSGTRPMNVFNGGGDVLPGADAFSSGSNIGPRPGVTFEGDKIPKLGSDNLPLFPENIDFRNIPRFDIKTEALKTITFKNGLVEFQYKSPNVKEITIESVSTSDIDPIYMDALVESLNKKKWLEIAN